MDASQKTILVVDDDPDVQALFRIHLGAAGYRVLLAGDGISCVALARQEAPDLVILDLGLPAGDGESALRNLRGTESLRGMRVLVVSGREAAAWSEMLRDLGADDYDVGCNWKLAMDTFGETYHFDALHANTLANVFYGNVQCYDTFGGNHRMILCQRDIDMLRGLPEEQ